MPTLNIHYPKNTDFKKLLFTFTPSNERFIKAGVMNKIIISLCVCFIIPLFLFAQYDTQTSILTEDGIFTVSHTEDGKDMICFNVYLWDDMMKGTKYTSQNLIQSSAKKVCIQMSNKKELHCRSGIGFRCGIFDQPNKLKNTVALVNSSNRICLVSIQKQDAGTIKIIFLDKVDWLSLQNDQ